MIPFRQRVVCRGKWLLKPETQRLVQEEIRRCHFHSVDEVIVQGAYVVPDDFVGCAEVKRKLNIPVGR